MTDETEVEDEDEGEEYEASPPELVYEDSCLVLDPAWFAEEYDAAAIQMKDGALYVLGRETHKWRNVEEWGAPSKPGTRLKSVQ